MFSSDILIQASDQNATVDLSTGAIINNAYADVILEARVRLNHKSTGIANEENEN